MNKDIEPFYQIEYDNGIRTVKELEVPIDLNLIITKICNANCIHCCASANEISEEFSLTKIKEIIKIAEKNNVFYFVITGGEPLMYKNFWRLLDLLNNKFGIIINTNGTLIDEKTAKRLAKYNIANLHISLDASNQEIYNLQRGSTTQFNQVLKGIKNSIKNKIDVTSKLVITNLNKDSIEDVIKLSISLCIKQISIAWFKPVGRGEINSKKLNIPKEERIKTTKNLYNLKENYEDRINISFDDAQCFPFLIKEIKNIKYRKLCGDYFCRIDQTGDVYPCPFLEVKIGNVFKEDLRGIWAKKSLKNLRNLSCGKNLLGICKQCKYNLICAGGCRARSFVVYGDLLHKDPFCWIEQ